MKFSTISNGKYFVEVKLNNYLTPKKLLLFEQQFREIKQHEQATMFHYFGQLEGKALQGTT